MAAGIKSLNPIDIALWANPLSALTDKLDADTIEKLPKSVKILSNFAVGFGNIDTEAAKKKILQ